MKGFDEVINILKICVVALFCKTSISFEPEKTFCLRVPGNTYSSSV